MLCTVVDICWYFSPPPLFIATLATWGGIEIQSVNGQYLSPVPLFDYRKDIKRKQGYGIGTLADGSIPLLSHEGFHDYPPPPLWRRNSSARGMTFLLSVTTVLSEWHDAMSQDYFPGSFATLHTLKNTSTSRITLKILVEGRGMKKLGSFGFRRTSSPVRPI